MIKRSDRRKNFYKKIQKFGKKNTHTHTHTQTQKFWRGKKTFKIKKYSLTLDKANHLDQRVLQRQHQLHGQGPQSQGHHDPYHDHQLLHYHQRLQKVEHFHSGCTHHEMQNLHLNNCYNNVISEAICIEL